MNCYVETMQKLHHQQLLLEKSNSTHIADWLKALDEPSLEQIPTTLLNKAIELRNKMHQGSSLLIIEFILIKSSGMISIFCFIKEIAFATPP